VSLPPGRNAGLSLKGAALQKGFSHLICPQPKPKKDSDEGPESTLILNF
jgi:hypothetical protein